MTEPFPPFPHPETGELLEAEAQFRAALEEINERLSPLWRVQRAIREAWAERFDPAEMPGRRYRTEKQERVTRCPRCGGKEEAA